MLQTNYKFDVISYRNERLLMSNMMDVYGKTYFKPEYECGKQRMYTVNINLYTRSVFRVSAWR